MEKKDKNDHNRMAKAPLADESHQLEPSITGNPQPNQPKEPGKLPDPKDDFGVDHNSDSVIEKTP